MFDGITISPLKVGDYEAVKSAASKDGHGVVFATHIVKKYGEIIGYASLRGMPVFTGWLDSKKVSPRDSAICLQKVDDHLRMSGLNSYAALCTKESPFFPIFEKRHNKLDEYSLFERVF